MQEKIKNGGNFSRHKNYCGTSEHQVDCPHCTKTYSRKDDLKKHIKKFHSKGAKRKAGDGISSFTICCFRFDDI